MSAKYALIIANTDYTDPGLAKLSAPGRDAEEFARVLKSQDICGFENVNVLLNQSEPAVRDTIDAFFDQKKPDDLLVLYFSGHGVRDEQGVLYLALQNTNRFRLRTTAIKSDFIRESMDQSRSKRQVIILDCCNSGAFAKGTKAVTGGSVGTASAFEGRGYGHVVLTASDATQFAWEGDKVIGETQNSLFTHFLVKGLEGEADNDGDGRITTNELYDYAYEQIVGVTPKQTPSKWSYKEQGEIALRESTRIEDIKAVPLPTALIDSIENPFADVRLGGVQQLVKLLNGKNHGLARSAKEALERISVEDDSRTVSRTALQALEAVSQAEQLALQKAGRERLSPEKPEMDRRVQEEADRLAKHKAEEERIAKMQLEAMRLAEEKRRAEEKAEGERKAKEEVERLAKQKAVNERLAYEKAEAMRKAREKEVKFARVEAEHEAAKSKDIEPKTISEAKKLQSTPVNKINPQASISPLRVFEGHEGEVVCLAFSPDQRKLASGSWDGTIRLWDVSNGMLLNLVKDNPMRLIKTRVHSVAFSPDGRTLASGSDKNTVQLWRVSDGRLAQTIQAGGVGIARLGIGGEGLASIVAFSPDGSALAAGCHGADFDTSVRLWRISDGKLLRTFKARGNVNCVAFSPDGSILAAAADDFTVRLWRISDGKHTFTLKWPEVMPVGLDFSRDGSTLSMATLDKLWQWKVSDGTLFREFDTLNGFSVAFSSDGQKLATPVNNNEIIVLRISDGKLLNTFKGRTWSQAGVAFSSDGRLLASGSDDGTIRMWNITP